MAPDDRRAAAASAVSSQREPGQCISATAAASSVEELKAEARALEIRLQDVLQRCEEAKAETADACAKRRSLAWQTENLELKLQGMSRAPAATEAALLKSRKSREALAQRYDAELAGLRQRLEQTVAVNKELRLKCQELERGDAAGDTSDLSTETVQTAAVEPPARIASAAPAEKSTPAVLGLGYGLAPRYAAISSPAPAAPIAPAGMAAGSPASKTQPGARCTTTGAAAATADVLTAGSRSMPRRAGNPAPCG
eukprot:TRINITY_DN58558_c0_g1_i1.p1 TRINITY_DN58558_c0_g1~~TRINITY_DN58558_c0_g1_i1.p1  ORF type:complete len:254 (+),score=71.61 TRINITY_DN58558_c0_g1_i1:116-877(+)